MFATIFAVIGLLSPPVVQSCDEMRLTAALASEAIFLDPSLKNRTKATQNVLKILPSRSCDFLVENLEIFDWLCMDHVLAYLDERGDSRLLWEADKSLRDFYAGCTLTDEQRRAVDVRILGPRDLSSLIDLPYHPDPIARASFWGASPAEYRKLFVAEARKQYPDAKNIPDGVNDLAWIFDKYPNRLDRLNAVLNTSNQINVGPVVWAVEELTADQDPRKWDPVDVAVLLSHARSCLGRMSALCRDVEVVSPHSHYTPSGSGMRRIFSSALSRMGIARSLKLMNENGMANIAQADLGALPTAFPYASVLCAREGDKCEQWLREMDGRAPSPDLDQVRKALRKLDEPHGKPN